MIKALDKSDRSVDICDSLPDELYFCPICKQKVMQRKGDIRAHHYAHYGLKEANYVPCTDTWHSHYDISEWHMNLQRAFPKDCYEVVVEHDGKKHIADVLIGNIVVEFQHSAISYKVFRERTDFYNACGYHVVWIFDLTKEYEDEFITKGLFYNGYDWPQPRLLFRKLDKEEIATTIYLQLESRTSKSQKVFERLISYRNSFKMFFTDMNNRLSVNDLVTHVMDQSIVNGLWKQKKQVEKERKEKEACEKNPIPKGKTIYQLWYPWYRYMIVQNLEDGKFRSVWNNGQGRMRTENGWIMAAYRNTKYSGGYTFSKPYVLKNGEAEIWRLVYADDEGYNHSGRAKLWDIINKLTLDGEVLVMSNDDKKVYSIKMKIKNLYDCREINISTGEIGSKSEWDNINPKRDLHIWKEL